MAKRWQDDVFEDLTFGDVKHDPAPKLRRTVTALKVAIRKSDAIVAQRAVATTASPKPRQLPPLRSRKEANELDVGIGPSCDQVMDNMFAATMGELAIDVEHAESATVHPE